jgi:hypothetical protein
MSLSFEHVQRKKKKKQIRFILINLWFELWILLGQLINLFFYIIKNIKINLAFQYAIK